MTGYLVLADGTALEGEFIGPEKTAMGLPAANTAVVGFQEMITDPVYKGRILVFTYPEVGNVGVTAAFSESSRVQPAAVVVKVLSEYRSHYLSEDSLENLLARDGVPCLTGVDTRGLAIHLRDKGELPAAVAPAGADREKVRRTLAQMQRPEFKPCDPPTVPAGKGSPIVAVIDLGIRNSLLRQLTALSTVKLFPHDVDGRTILKSKPAAVFISDGPSNVLPPERTVETIKGLLGEVPILACGLGHVALGVALGGHAIFLKRGHHGANYPVKNLETARVEVTEQRHSVCLDRESIVADGRVKLLWENLNDSTVEGILAADAPAIGLQVTLASPDGTRPNPHIQEFIESLSTS